VTTDLPIFLNPGAGRGTEREAVQRIFEAAGAKPVIHTLDGARTHEVVLSAIRNGATIIGAAGGDGTISAIANIVSGTDAALLPIPLGTLNHFSKRYGIASIDAAAHAWQKASPKPVHVGCVNDMVFVNNASAGFYPHMVRHRERLERFLPRLPAMWLGGLRSFIEMPMLHLEMKTAEQARSIKTPVLWVGIGRNSMRLPVPGDTEIEGGVLEAVSGKAQTRLGILALSFRMLRHLKRGLEPRDDKLDVLHARSFTVQSHHSVDLALDGEPQRLRTPLNFEIRENGLNIVCLVAPAG
jgi:diacylglycerol kinase family enzyme